MDKLRKVLEADIEIISSAYSDILGLLNSKPRLSPRIEVCLAYARDWMDEALVRMKYELDQQKTAKAADERSGEDET